MDETWIVLCSSAALLLRLGLSLYLGGAVRAKNAGGMILRIAADFFVITLCFWSAGWAVSQHGTMLGMNCSLMFGGNAGCSDAAHALRLLVVALIAGGIFVGAAAERMKFYAGLWASALVGAVLVPLAGRWVWTGWLAHMGYHDFAGASVVHVTGAMVALVGAVLVGPRMGKYNRDGSANVLPGHSVLLACAGMVVMLIAWLPYVFSFASPSVSGAMGLIAEKILLAGSAGGMASLIYGQLRFGKADIFLTFSGMLGGLVAISASADVVSTRAAVVIGGIAGVIIPWATLQIDLIWRVDDPSGAIAMHGGGGIWGIVATAIFVPGITIGEKAKLLGVQLLGLIVLAALAVISSAVVLLLVKKKSGLRSKEADEFDGLDLAEHDIGAYPDFQQTTIKSYHLREA